MRKESFEKYNKNLLSNGNTNIQDMNRRNFIKNIGITASTVAAIPMVIEELSTPHMNPMDVLKEYRQHGFIRYRYPLTYKECYQKK